ncbi:MAG: haloacid dehalogenase, partial [Candidatus Limnocylindrales bacterium]
MRTTLDYDSFGAMTFDCYGTLVDWEAGLISAFAPILDARGLDLDTDDVLARYARYEAAAEAGPYLRYRDVLAAGLRGVAGELGFEPTAGEVEAFSGSV